MMLDLFPSQVGVGVDLGNVEIKECNNNLHKFTLKEGDDKADFILFYDWMEDLFLICNAAELPRITAKRSISLKQVKKWAYFQTQDIDDLMAEASEILKDQTYLPVAYQLIEGIAAMEVVV